MEEFLSTPSARRATYELRRENQQYKRFLSTPSARRATRQDSRQKLGHTISIHALREEGDGGILFRPVMAADDFYPRPPRGGRRIPGAAPADGRQFLSTPSARRATSCSLQIWLVPDNFYPRPPRGGRPPIWRSPGTAQRISIHALREEGDFPQRANVRAREIFLSTPSARRATRLLYQRQPPCGFLSTPSARRATGNTIRLDTLLDQISIHALREEGDMQRNLIS